MKQTICVLGSTGSVGVSTLDVIARHPDRFSVFALTGAHQVEKMVAQCATFRPKFAVMADEAAGRMVADRLRAESLPTQAMWGAEALNWVAGHELVDTVMAAIVGAAGLVSAYAAVCAGKRLLLANKESLVVGGRWFMAAVNAHKACLLPVDSEHSAVFQALPEDASTWASRVAKIILTASGGPFRTRAPSSFRDITPEQACAHPNWVMGRKISVDSATMMNKALEVIEAHHLFSMSSSQLDVVIHPQSVVHSMVEFLDTSVVAQLGTPDMRVPIAYALSWPNRMESGAKALNFSSLAALTFESIHEPDHQARFPCLALAWAAMDAPEGTCAVLNAANEVAVSAFLERRLRFDQIYALNDFCLSTHSVEAVRSLDDLLALDAQTRAYAAEWVGRQAR